MVTLQKKEHTKEFENHWCKETEDYQIKKIGIFSTYCLLRG